MRLAFAADHAGAALKNQLIETARAAGHDVVDLGTDGADSVDYPDFGRSCAERVAGGEVERGVIVCGTGIGIAIAANRVAGARCAVVHDVTTARLARSHNDANLMALGARVVGAQVAVDCLMAFLDTTFEGGRHQRRVAKLG
ncbi:MAG: ribose 5-phosphate isomerase B [Alphaproteobacteria bacterium]|jgi:ribose 5-phosphate isomerase B|nr:ribose 5-phosphate isomerase B [Alphaproteobacteria bacterium]